MAVLANRAVIVVAGPERTAFLDRLLTCDLEAPPGPLYGALLTPQGKVVADLFLTREVERIVLDVPAPVAADLLRRLQMYRLRAAVEIAASPEVVTIGEGGPPDPRGNLGARAVAATGRDDRDALAAYDAARAALGIPDAVVDFALLDAFPHDANMDLTGGVAFAKGCFVGQEVVSRMKHRGTARRRTVCVAADAPLPPTGTDLTVEGRVVGRLGTIAGDHGLAVVRIDRVGGEAEAAGVPVRLSPPPGAPFALAVAATDEAAP